MNAWGQSSTRLPFYCARCGSLYPEPQTLVECLARHEENDLRMREAQDAMNVALASPVQRP